MIELIKKVLDSNKAIDGYEIVETITKSKEFFLIEKNLDMDRGKHVQNFNIVVYKDIIEGDKKLRGVASTMLHPTMTEDEMIEEVNEAVFAAQFAKNEYYPLVKAGQEYSYLAVSSFSKENLSYWINNITKVVYKNDINENGSINSCEIFLDKVYTRVINSEGIDVNFENYSAMVEFIPTCKGEKEEIELYSSLKFSNFNQDTICEEVENSLLNARERALAVPTPQINDIPVLLTGKSIYDLISYYYFKSTAAAVYNKQSAYKIGDNIQGLELKGDSITLKLDPFMENSTYSAPFSKDGLPLKATTIIENGILKNYVANNKYAYYLNVEPTGDSINIVMEGGSKSIDEFKADSYFEIIAFSDFTVDNITGNFGGEIRLARYFNGDRVIAVTGGALSGNINKIHHDMYFSKELQKDNNFYGPKAIKLNNVNIVGVSSII